ncbi:MAG: phosphatidylserine decarboxylase family protein [Deltaproteobacteria bacterium]|nr:phosphatidylserine decarboxylase family protein [Deltaproteobacteria bacterium]
MGMQGFKIATPGYRFLAASVLLIFFGWFLGSGVLEVLGLVALVFFGYFFRDPERPIPGGPEDVVSPADGKVVFIEEVQEERYLNGPARRVAIFMNVFDVHVNRAPVAGRIAESEHRDGCFKAAWREDACTLNEQQALVLESNGARMLVVQIAGLLARRIISYVQPGQYLDRGERLGMICFGSRVDLYLPLTAGILVKVGDRVKAGSSIVARWP